MRSNAVQLKPAALVSAVNELTPAATSRILLPCQASSSSPKKRQYSSSVRPRRTTRFKSNPCLAGILGQLEGGHHRAVIGRIRLNDDIGGGRCFADDLAVDDFYVRAGEIHKVD